MLSAFAKKTAHKPLSTRSSQEPTCFDDPQMGSENWCLCWRQLTLELTATLKNAARAHPEMAPIFMESLANALEYLLLFGDQDDFEALSQWLQDA